MKKKKCEMYGNLRVSIDDCFLKKKNYFVEFEEYEII